MSDSKLNPFARKTAITKDPVVKDLFGRALAEGDTLYMQTAVPPPFKVVKIVPVVDPNQPSNLMDITVSCQLRFRSVRDESVQEFVRVMTADENKPPAVELN